VTKRTAQALRRGWVKVPSRVLLIVQMVLLTFALWFLTVKFFLNRLYTTPLGTVWGVLDDVYITADYARTLAHGGGLAWFEGAPRVEGFSSPLWVFVLALLHLNPGFTEGALGVHVVAVNLVLVLGLSIALTLAVCPRDANQQRLAPSFSHWLVLSGLLLLCVSAYFWTAAGFETALTALLPLVAFVLVGGPASARRATLIGLSFGAAFFCRMDSILLCWPVLGVMAIEQRWRRFLLLSAGLWLVAALALFAARRAYFGEWLPNTYFLKATGWDLDERLWQGFLQNRSAIYCFAFVIVPLSALLLPAVRQRRSEILALLLAYAGTLVYSTSLGGDFAWEVLGYDRFTATGSLFLACGLARLICEASVRPLLRFFAVPLATLAIALPIFSWVPYSLGRWIWRQPLEVRGLLRFRRSLEPRDLMAERVVHFGKAVEQVTKPGAVVAVCAAGAIPYFSRRKAIDVLGKMDKHVARLSVPRKPPREIRCWRGFPGAGHNKEDLAYSFRARPDVSTFDPPERYRSQYRQISHEGFDIWLRNDSKLVSAAGEAQ